MSVGMRRSGSMPACCRSSTRRGDPEARTSLLEAFMMIREPRDLLLETIGNATLAQVVRGHFNQHLVARQYANAVLAPASSRVSDDLLFVFELHPEHGIGQQLCNYSRPSDAFFLRHPKPSFVPAQAGTPTHAV